MKDQAQTRQKQAGFTLIEIMITIAITGIVLAALISAFRNQSVVFQQQTDLTKSSASARAALYMMARDIRLAGYTGLPVGWQKVLPNAAPPAPQNLTPVDFYPVVSLKDGPKVMDGATFLKAVAADIKAIPGNAAANSPDAILIWGNFLRRTSTLKNSVSAGATQIMVNDVSIFSGTGFMKPAWAMIGTPGSSIYIEMYPISGTANSSTAGAANGTITISGALKKDYNATLTSTYTSVTPPALVVPIHVRVYFVRPKETGTTGAPEPKLYVRNYYDPNNKDNFTEAMLAQGVIDLQFNYDTLDTNTPPRLTPVDWVCDPCTIRGVNITLRTWSNKFRANNPLEREFSTAVRIRNLGLGTVLTCTITGCPP